MLTDRYRSARTMIAGGAGAVMALGLSELLQSFFETVPSIPVAVSQRVIELTPGDLATAGIQTVGKAATPILVAVVVVSTILVSALLALLSRRSPLMALLGACALGVIGLLAALAEPVVQLSVLSFVVFFSLFAGLSVARPLLSAAGSPRAHVPDQSGETEPGERTPEPFHGRYREAHSGEGISIGRGSFLLLSGGAVAGGLAAASAGRVIVGRLSGSEAAARRLERPSGAARVAARQTLPPAPAGASIEAPGMPPLFTPNDDFYLIDTAISAPRINRDRWMLTIGGTVSNAIELTYEDLLSFPTREADITLSCVSNEVGGNLISNGRWTGVILSDVLAEAGVRLDAIDRAAEQLIGRSADGWEAGFRTETALDGREALLAFGLNGDELPVNHGYPVRLVVPGLYGYVSATKWLTEIELTDWSYDAYWIKRGWAKEGPIKTQSRIDTIRDGDTLTARTVRIGGIAWAPHRGIERVEVSTDNGETWSDATLAAQLDVDAWRLWIFDWDALSAGDYTVKVRATDGNGETQPAEEAPPIPSGATGYHTVNVSVR